MTDVASQTRRFTVRAQHEDVRHGRIVIEPSFEAAAIAYVEHLPLRAGERPEVAVVVHDLDSGHEHSFVIHLDSGEAKAVG